MSEEWNTSPPKPPSAWDMDKRIALLEQSQKDIKVELQNINGNITKLVWIVVGAVVVGVINLLMRSGGNVPGI